MATPPFFSFDAGTDSAVVGPNLTIPGFLTVTGATTLAGGLALGGDLDMGSHGIHNLAAPAAPADAATKAYVDAVPSGMAAGPPTSVQYNAGGPFGGDANFTWLAGGQLLSVGGATPRVLVGAGPADAGAALQLKTDGTGPFALGAAAAAPSDVTVQSRAVSVGAGPVLVQTLRLADRTLAYCDLALVGAVTAGPLGQSNVFHRRFRLARFDLGGGTTLSAVTSDFTEAQTAGTGVQFAVAGTDLQVSAVGAAGATVTWDAATRLCVSAPW